jgi:hypothetical protein
MNPELNPFAPGAGTQPPQLAGREGILSEVETTLRRMLRGAPSRSAIFVGLRGVGKTVLLNRVREIAEENRFLTVSMEAHEAKSLPELLIPHLRKVLLKLNAAERVNELARRGLRVLKSFASGFKGKVSFPEHLNVELGFALEAGAADSGDLEHDLGELLVAIAEAAQSRQTAVCLLIDELQYLSETELSALIIGLHQVAQRRLPLIVYAAGLPLILGLAGRSKSYAERLFTFPRIGVLEPEAARQAIERPLADLQVALTPDALDAILLHTGRYPYFLQQWGYEAWNLARATPITANDITRATESAIRQLDESFFRVRFDRLTRREKDFLFAMLRVGGETQRSGEIAAELQVRSTSVGPLRSALMRKGMIYSPAHGDNAFTVPLFNEFLSRQLNE